KPLFFMAELVGRTACLPSGPAGACSASSSSSVSLPHAGWSQAFCPYAPGPRLPLGRAGSTPPGTSFKCCASWANYSSCCGGPGGSKLAFSVWTSLLSLLHAANDVFSPPPFCPWEVNLVSNTSLEESGILESRAMMEQIRERTTKMDFPL
ncbi:Cnga2: Cyclic nucleotide-gated olfactory channel, partial [Crotalus adamanteus]